MPLFGLPCLLAEEPEHWGRGKTKTVIAYTSPRQGRGRGGTLRVGFVLESTPSIPKPYGLSTHDQRGRMGGEIGRILWEEVSGVAQDN